jgi:hypothetical protein
MVWPWPRHKFHLIATMNRARKQVSPRRTKSTRLGGENHTTTYEMPSFSPIANPYRQFITFTGLFAFSGSGSGSADEEEWRSA